VVFLSHFIFIKQTTLSGVQKETWLPEDQGEAARMSSDYQKKTSGRAQGKGSPQPIPSTKAKSVGIYDKR
jgi:hypothetical protein